MSRGFQQKNYQTRWSEPNLCKPYLPYSSASSVEEEMDFAQPSRSQIRATSGDDRLMDCCLCYEYRNKRKSSKYLTGDDIKTRSNGRRSQRMRQSMELRLIGSQVEEALADDSQAALIQQLDLVSNALEALIHYVQSLRVTNLAAHRALDVGHLLIGSRVPTGKDSFKTLAMQLEQVENKKKARVSFLQDLIEYCSKSMIMSRQLRVLMDEHKSRKEDFSIAARNFRNFLSTSKLSTSQLEKLRRQYDEILDDYQQSRRILDMELPKVVNVRLVTLYQGFGKIVELFSDLDYFKEISSVFQLLGENLCDDDCGKEVFQKFAFVIPRTTEKLISR
ncbi:hypothetical protein KPH14_004103 [Odynerus spinipes]|uniref:Uncharacterized protein n=1 Tax=Odynerus spinipes TaxID=1348599 RepID=A0AAD9RY03_9HYME|nr:hypothetical protein KPH14_004103 [Odynerus spinipes]